MDNSTTTIKIYNVFKLSCKFFKKKYDAKNI